MTRWHRILLYFNTAVSLIVLAVLAAVLFAYWHDAHSSSGQPVVMESPAPRGLDEQPKQPGPTPAPPAGSKAPRNPGRPAGSPGVTPKGADQDH
jgi:hypothetical protein